MLMFDVIKNKLNMKTKKLIALIAAFIVSSVIVSCNKDCHLDGELLILYSKSNVTNISITPFGDNSSIISEKPSNINSYSCRLNPDNYKVRITLEGGTVMGEDIQIRANHQTVITID